MSNSATNNTKTIEIGKFYLVFDGSKTGHPGLVIWKDNDANRYLVIRFDSDRPGEVPKKQRGIRHITKLSHVIGEGIATSYIKNRPLLCKRKDIGKAWPNLSVHQDDWAIIENASKKESEIKNSLKRRK